MRMASAWLVSVLAVSSCGSLVGCEFFDDDSTTSNAKTVLLGGPHIVVVARKS